MNWNTTTGTVTCLATIVLLVLGLVTFYVTILEPRLRQAQDLQPLSESAPVSVELIQTADVTQLAPITNGPALSSLAITPNPTPNANAD